jgi:RHS repeat-associated protein
VIAAPATITLTATATPGAGRRILRVDFFQGTSRIGTDTSAPYGITWSNVPRGNYILTATAIDSGGSVAVSNPVVIRVDTPPTVTLTSPANNTVFTPGANIPLTARAADADEIVTKVEFFSGTTLLGTQFVAPYDVAWNNVPAGRYTLTARATDLVGLTTTSAPVVITVDAPPTVAITSPANNALFVASATVTISATAADADGSVTQVEFFDGATLVGTVSNISGSATYRVTLANLGAGTHTLTARATDNQGATTTSVAVTITVNSNVAQIYYIHPDQLNTPRLISDQAGNTVWRNDNTEPFGDAPPNSNPSGLGAFEFNLRFPGQNFDRETNLAYNWRRDYDSSVGRYIESDPIGLGGGLNTFLYVRADPLRLVDLTGEAIGGLPSQPPEDLPKKFPGRFGQGLSGQGYGIWYGLQCAQRCTWSGPKWVVDNASMICLEIIPAIALSTPQRNDILFSCEKTCKEHAPKICPPPLPRSSCDSMNSPA